MYIIVLTLFICIFGQGQVNRNFQLVLNENVPIGQVGHDISTALLILCGVQGEVLILLILISGET